MANDRTQFGFRAWYLAALFAGGVLATGLTTASAQASPLFTPERLAKSDQARGAGAALLQSNSLTAQSALAASSGYQSVSWAGSYGRSAPESRFQQAFFGKIFGFFSGGKKSDSGGGSSGGSTTLENGGGNNGGQNGSFATLSPHVPEPGNWRLVPGTAFKHFRLSNAEADFLGVRGGTGSTSVLTHWNGSAYDPQGHFWYFWGGGQGAYGGNEVYRIDLESVRIERITTPSSLDSNIQDNNGHNCAVPTLEPSAGSTYDGIVWSPDTQTIIVYPTGRFCPGGNLNQASAWEFDPVAFSWSQIAPTGTVGGQVLAEYDPSRRRLVVIDGNGTGAVRALDPVTGQHGTTGNLGVNLSEGSAVLQSIDDELLTITREGIHSIPLGALSPAQQLAALPNGMDPQAGGIYESGRGLLVVWEGGKDIRTFDPNTQQWDLYSNSNGPTRQGQGVFSKFIYIEELDAFAGYNHVDEGIWLYRLPIGAGGSNGTFSAPVADAGNNQNVGKGQTVSLDGRGSSDADGDPLTYFWELTAKPSGSSASISSSSASRPTFVADREGSYSIRLTVNDGVLTDQDTVQITAANRAPVADAGNNQSVTVGNSVSLNGNGSSDPDGDSITYAWSFSSKPGGSSATISSANSRNASFVPDVEGSFVVSLVVNDGTVQSAADQMTVTAAAQGGGGNPPPVNPGDYNPDALPALAQHSPDQGKWSLVPNTKFDLIRMTQSEVNAIDPNIWGNSGSGCVLESWNSGVYDNVGHKFYFFGGGHACYGGNEVYALDLETLELERLNDPAPLTNNSVGSSGCPYPGSGPSSTHTYDGLVWSPPTQTMLSFSDMGFCVSNLWYGNWLGEFNPTSSSWSRIGGFSENTVVFPMAAYDPDSGIVWTINTRDGNTRLRGWDPVAKRYTGTGNALGWITGGSAWIHNGEMYWTDGEGEIAKVPLSYSATASIKVTDLPAGLSHEGGVAVHPASNLFVFWNGDNKIWTYDVDNDQWQTYSPSSGPNSSAQIYGKFVYVPELDAFAGYQNRTEGLWLYRLPASVSDPTPQDPGSGGNNGSADFATRCAGSGIIQCVDFDTQASVAPHIACGASCPTVDTAIAASGGGSLKMTIPSQSGPDTSGTFRTNFTPGTQHGGNDPAYPIQFGEGEEFYVQWRQRFSASFLNTFYQSAHGWKQIILGQGDRPGVIASSCTPLEVVVQNSDQRGFPTMYHSCGVKDGKYEGLDTQVGSFDFDLQPPNQCLYSDSNAGQATDPPCFLYYPDEWMSFQVRVKIGTWYHNDGVYCTQQSRINDAQNRGISNACTTIELWISREGQPARKVISINDYDLVSVDSNALYGKVWLLPYNTEKSASQVHAEGYTWYDELIISRNRIPDPN